MEINGVAFKEVANGEANASQSLAETFDSFLVLLTTQLQNQDPLDPMNSEQFTQQLVQFAGVEQAISTNKKLDKLIGIQDGSQISNVVSFMGETVEIASDQLLLADSSAAITYSLDGAAAEAKISIVDQTGRTVRVLNAETAAGKHRLVWDGRSQSGVVLPDGLYSFAIAAVDANDRTVRTATGTEGRVTGVEIRDEGIYLNIGELAVPADSVIAVREPEVIL